MRSPGFVLGLVLAGIAAPPARAQWVPLASGTNVSLRGLSLVDDRVAWASGQRGTVIHTGDGGTTWRVRQVPGAERLDLRAIHARSARVAHVAATAGRIWRTTDGGDSWTLRYEAADTSVFLDAIDFWDDRRGMALGDPMRGAFLVLLTDDGGETWREAPMAGRPAAEEGEAAFAASGSSLVLAPGNRAWLGSGGSVARLHRSSDGGRSWGVAATPVLQGGPSRGIFGLAVPSTGPMILVGGDYAQPDTTRDNATLTSDGRSFRAPASRPRAFRSGVAVFTPGGRPGIAIAVGPTGSDISQDHGVTWAPFDSAGFHAVRASPGGRFLATGSDGRVARFDATSPR